MKATALPATDAPASLRRLRQVGGSSASSLATTSARSLSTSSFASLACLETSRSWRRVCSSSVILCALRSETLEF